jgi:ADP-ribose pyrophosphatase YjhB (NUDIX family)
MIGVVHVDEQVLARLRDRYGEPDVLRWEGEVSEPEFQLATYDPARTHDVTLYVFAGERLALIRKPSYPEGIWRPPGGGIHKGEEFETGAQREALEEIGVEIELDRYLVATEARFTWAGRRVEWRTHVFSASADPSDTVSLTPRDAKEIEAARWGTLEELQGPIQERILATGRALWRYRAALHDAAAAALRDQPPL